MSYKRSKITILDKSYYDQKLKRNIISFNDRKLNINLDIKRDYLHSKISLKPYLTRLP